MKYKRNQSEISSGSMADISFLLLIFFMIATTIDSDKGLLVKLPPIGPDIVATVNEDRVLSVHINKKNELLVEKTPMNIDELRSFTQEFLLNPDHRDDRPDFPKEAIISLQHDRETSYETYLGVYNELQAAYNEIWNDMSIAQYGQPYSENLSLEIRKAIKTEVPMVISEAEPVQF